jgi:Tfp pilus assembly protein PilN
LIRINLLPKQPRRLLQGKPIVEIGLPVAAVVLALLVSLFLMNQRNGLEAAIAKAKAEADALRPEVEQVMQLDRQIAVMKTKEQLVSNLLKQQLPAASILNEVRLLIPKDVWTLALNVPEPSSLSMEGMAVNYYAVARLMDNLTSGQLFRSVDLTVAQAEKVGGNDIVRFQITARILKPQAAAGGGRQ